MPSQISWLLGGTFGISYHLELIQQATYDLNLDPYASYYAVCIGYVLRVITMLLWPALLDHIDSSEISLMSSNQLTRGSL